MRRNVTILFLLLYSIIGVAQESPKVTVSGVVSEAQSGETLIGANITVEENNAGTITNEYGFYSLSLPSGESYKIEFSYVGYNKSTIQLQLDRDTIINIDLFIGVELEEVVVKANSFKEQINSTEMSVEVVTAREVKLIPSILGETDILKAIQLKPGIASGSEGSTGLFVRGGGNDQNLIVLDEAIVYNPNHLFGFFSTFNSDAIKNMKAYKGGFPAQYGGRLSSVVDIKLKEGNNKELEVTGGIGLITSRLTVEGPIQKGKSSYIVSGRRTYADLITRGINKSNEDKEDFNPIPDYFFYDLNTKINFQLSDKDHLYISGYFGRDEFKFEDDDFNFNFDWGNATGTVRWNHVFNPKLFANTTFTLSDYRYNIENRFTGFTFKLGSNIKDGNLKLDFYNVLNTNHTLRFGGNLTYHRFEVGRLKFNSDDGDISFSAGQNYDGWEFGAYAAEEWEVTERLKISSGLRLSGFSNDGKTYLGVEPRFSAKYSLSDRLAVKGSYSRMYQYIHLVSNTSIALPTDIWYPSTKGVKPQRADQFAAGFSYILGEKFLLSNEYYFKFLDRQIDFKDWAQLFANDELEKEFRFGEGRAYGMELSIEKKEGQLKGWVGYTLALIEKKFDDIMNGRYFSPRYDRRHDLSVVLMYDLSKRVTVTSTFVYGSGDRAWLPEGRGVFTDINGGEFQPIVSIYGDRNTFRLAPYSRLDLGLIWRFFPSWGEHDLTFSIYNTTGRRNPYFVFIDPILTEVDLGGGVSEEFLSGVQAKQVSLFPLIPSITWNFKF